MTLLSQILPALKILPGTGRGTVTRSGMVEGAGPNHSHHLNNRRHPELVSGSMAPNKSKVATAKWMLKQVQHDGVF
jgi:hypothetical protein